MDDTKWFSRLAEVPQVGYCSNPSVDRLALPGHDARPDVHSFDFNGELNQSLSWPTAEGSTSQSPASAWYSFGDSRHPTSAEVFRRVYEALELPGTATDYHFAILHAYGILWSRLREDVCVLEELERLLLLDVVLVESRPDILQLGGEDETFWAAVPAFYHLMTFYEREGYVADALGIARRAAALRQGGEDVERLEDSLAGLRAERLAEGA